MLPIITTLLLIKNYIKLKFPDLDYHSIYRSLFCFAISTLSCFTIFLEWNTFISDPMAFTLQSYLINTFMVVYMAYDLIWIFVKKRFRFDLFIHHVVCLIVYMNYRSHILLTYYAINEIISAFNWVSLVFPNFEWLIRILKLCSILFVRLIIWINGLVLMHNTEFFNIILVCTTLFLSLDIFWITVIIGNIFKNLAKKTIQYIKKNKDE